MVENHFAPNSLVVLADRRATPEERQEFAEWAMANLFSNGLRGAFYRWLTQRRLEQLPAMVTAWELRARALGRSTIGTVRQLFIPGILSGSSVNTLHQSYRVRCAIHASLIRRGLPDTCTICTRGRRI